MDEKELWRATLGELEIIISPANFTTWFRETFIIEKNNKTLIVAAPNSFAKEWLEKKFHPEIKQIIKKLAPEIEIIRYKIKQENPPAFLEELKELNPQPPTPRPPVEVVKNGTLNDQYTFETFVIGSSNRLAAATAKAVAEKPGKTYNPFYIYGGVGLGKTHLMQAIGNDIIIRNPKKKVVYVSCESFTNEFVQSIANNKMADFKKNYRNVDVLLVDDIQFLSSKEGFQEEFFHTFNALHQSGRQIILTSDRVPKAIPALEERLSSRFGWGMVADIQSPNLEMREAILRSKSKEKNFQLTEEVLEYIAKNVRFSIRDLEGALNRVHTYCALHEVEASLDLTQKVLLDFVDTKRSRNLTCDNIIKTVAGFFGQKLDELLGPRRDKELVRSRHLIMYLLRHEMNLSFPRISRELGKKDHTTIIHGCNKIEKEIARDQDMRNEISIIKEKLFAV